MTVVPGGAPEDDKVTALLKLPVRVVNNVELPADPGATPSTLGEFVIVKPGCRGAVTVSVIGMFCDYRPDVPLNVME